MARQGRINTDDVLDMIFGGDGDDSDGGDAGSDLDIASESSDDELSADETEQTVNNTTDQTVNNSTIVEGGWTKHFSPIQV